MKSQAYRLFAVAAAPVAIWSAFEVALRLTVGPPSGLPGALLLGSCAAGSLAVCRWRLAAISAERPPHHDPSQAGR